MSCPKCRSREVVTRYHRARFLCDPWSRQTNNSVEGEHLHRYCQGCGYDWCDPVADAPVDPVDLKAAVPEERG